jgi:hypothetical protein
MYYVTSVSENYPDSYWFEYDHDKSPDYLSFQSGSIITNIDTRPVFKLNKNISKKKLLEFDFLMSDGGDFISQKFANLIKSISPDDVQIIEADCFLNETPIGPYFIANILNIIPCADMTKSSYRPLMRNSANGPFKFTSIVFIENSLNGHLIVRCKEDPETIVVSDAFVQACKDNNIRGVAFLPGDTI